MAAATAKGRSALGTGRPGDRKVGRRINSSAPRVRHPLGIMTVALSRRRCADKAAQPGTSKRLRSFMRTSLTRIIVLGLTTAVPFSTAAVSAAPAPAMAASERSGQSDFDWEIGTWTTNVRLLRNPLSGKPPDWAQYQGTSVVRPILWGRANIVELSVAGPAGKVEGGSFRLYNPQARQWSLNFANLRNGLLTAPVYGGFNESGRGEFYGQDMRDGRAILVRFIITRVSEREARFVQSFSADGGATWEDNWIAIDTLR